MAFWDKVKGQFIDVIEWQDDSRDTIIWKFPRYDNEIKNGAQLIVRESQSAVFLHEGELGDVFKPGRHVLETSNLPILTTLASWKYAFDAPFKCDVYFVTTREFTDLKWGTKNPIMLRDAEFGPIRLRAFGTFCFKVEDSGALIKELAGTDSNYETDEVENYFKSILISRFTDELGEAKIPALDLAANYTEIGESLIEKIQPDFDRYGVKLSKFLIENISLPPAVEEALDKRSSMGVVGNLDQYSKFQTAEAIEDMANSDNGSGNMMGMIAGMNMGGVMGNNIQQAQQPSATPPPIPNQGIQWFAAIDGQQAGPFDQSAVQSQIQSQKITRDTLIWRQGMDNWTKASEVPEVAGFFGSAPPPIPPQ